MVFELEYRVEEKEDKEHCHIGVLTDKLRDARGVLDKHPTHVIGYNLFGPSRYLFSSGLVDNVSPSRLTLYSTDQKGLSSLALMLKLPYDPKKVIEIK